MKRRGQFKAKRRGLFDRNIQSIEDLKQFITINKHLPEIPNAKEMLTDGVNTSELLMGLLKKIEELTLYVIQQQAEINALKAK